MVSTNGTVIELLGVKKAFERPGQTPFVAIQDIFASVVDNRQHGEFVTIIGPSGCGKSTLLQMIAGFDTLIPPTEGVVKFYGEPVTGTSPNRGMLFQAYGSYPHLTVLQNIAFGLTLHKEELRLSNKEIEDRAYHWLNKVRLEFSDATKYPHELSGGMRQRVALARSLAIEPQCLLMDEPFSALDEPTRFEMQDLIIDLWAKIEATIVVVSHSVAEAVFLGDRVWVMSKSPGTIVAEFADIPKPTPDIPAATQQSQPEFTDIVSEVNRSFEEITRTPREDLTPIFANGRVCNGACNYRGCALRPPAKQRRAEKKRTKKSSVPTPTRSIYSITSTAKALMGSQMRGKVNLPFPLDVRDAGGGVENGK